MLNVLGQTRAVAQLQRSLASGRLASTWMFAGPAGVGKMTLAVELAKTHLCDKPRREKNAGRLPSLTSDFMLTLACGECDSCRAIGAAEQATRGMASNHPDLHIITKELIRYHDATGKSKGTTMSIHVIRGEITGDPAENKEAKIAKRSFRGRGKFFIIDEADLMEGPAQNALLKSLEEPPENTFLILITASPQELLQTIRSRSQLVEFRPLADDVIVRALVASGLSPEDAGVLARLSRGSLGRALRWREDMRVIDEANAGAAERAEKRKATTDSDDDVDVSTNKFTPGGILGWTRELGARLDALVTGREAASDVSAAISEFATEYAGLQLKRDKLASADRAKRDAIGLFVAIAAEWFSDRLRHGLGTPHRVSLPAEHGALDYAVVPRLIAAAREAEGQIDYNANEKILLAATTTRWEQLLAEAR